MKNGLHELLERFGFTEKERETYVTILQNGPQTIQEIVDASDVSRRHVYNIVDKLDEHRFVIKNDYITPTTIEPAPPEELKKELNDRTDELYQHVDSEYQQGVDVIDDVKVLKSRSTVIKKIKEMISSAEYRVAVSIPINFLPTLADVLQDAVERDVAVLVLVFEGDADVSSSPDMSMEGFGNVIRYRDETIPILLTVDRVSALVAPQAVVTQSFTQTNAVFLGQPYLNPVVFTSLMNTEWIAGEELYVLPHETLPTTYDNFPRAVIDATLHRQDDTPIRATIEAQLQDNADSLVEITGDVTDINQRFIEPIDSPEPGQTSLSLDIGDETVSVGGKDGYIEDYKAHLTTLRKAE